jgi:capsular exopolysaccharide synthesis family protein
MRNDRNTALFDELLNNSNTLDYHKILKIFLSRWYWIVGALGFFGLFCFLYLKLATPVYLSSITLKYSEKKSQLDEIGNSAPVYLFNTGSEEYLTEKYTIASPDVIQSALKIQNRSFTFYRIKDLRRIDVYPFQPVQITVLNYDPTQYEHGKFLLNEDLSLTYLTEACETTIAPTEQAIVKVQGLLFKIVTIHTALGYQYEFTYNEPSRMVAGLRARIKMTEVEEGMPILSLSFKHHNAAYTKDFLKNLLQAYQEYDLKQKQQSSDLTITFIENQTNLYSGLLKQAAQELEFFKKQNQIFDISSSATEITEKVREFEQRKNELAIQSAYISILETGITGAMEPVNYLSVGLDGTTDLVLIGLLDRYNTLISQRKNLVLKYSVNSATVKNTDDEIAKFKTQILDNINLQKQKNRSTARIVNENMTVLQSKLNQIPALEKNYIYLQSDFEVNKNIYSLLLNKEIESSIVRAGILPSFSVITQIENDKISPKPLQIIILSVFCGLLVGLGSVLATRLLNNTFTEIEEIEKYAKVSLLGVIHRYTQEVTNTQEDINNFLNDRSIFTESLSALRTRLNFAKDKRTPSAGGQVIMITSEKSGEGKSFVTLNLAISFTKIGKRVVVIGADLRKSKLHLFFDDANKQGLGSFLQNPDKYPYSSLIKNSNLPGLDYIPAGPAPFNPAELLIMPVFDDLVAYCRKHYDFVLFDTAPVGLVSDNIPMFTKSDHVVYIIRWLYSGKDSHRLADQLANEYDLPKMEVILNNFYPDNLYSNISTGAGYGLGSQSYYRYSYGYHENGYFEDSPQGWFKRQRKKLFNKSRK